MIKNTSNLDYVKNRYMRREQEELAKIYPNIDVSNKYILFVECELWFPYEKDDIKADIDFIYEDDVKNCKYKLRRPYPNKNITTISAVNGRRCSDLGIPVIFDSFKELEKLKSIKVKWKLNITDSQDKNLDLYVQVVYDLNFKYEEGKRIYSIFSKDTLPLCYEDKDLEKEYFLQFNKILFIKSLNNDGLNYEVIKEGKIDREKMDTECFEIVMENVGLKDFIDAADNNKHFMVLSYYAKETLNPGTVAENIIHI